jgi:hypothetical protein
MVVTINTKGWKIFIIIALIAVIAATIYLVMNGYASREVVDIIQYNQ